jgi:hypothetical protein
MSHCFPFLSFSATHRIVERLTSTSVTLADGLSRDGAQLPPPVQGQARGGASSSAPHRHRLPL